MPDPNLVHKSKEELLSIASRAKAELRNFAQGNQLLMGRMMGHMAAQAGGALGAVAKKYLPDLIPGEATTDEAALYGLALLLDVGAMAMGDLNYSNEANFLAAGFEGYISGSLTEKILP